MLLLHIIMYNTYINHACKEIIYLKSSMEVELITY